MTSAEERKRKRLEAWRNRKKSAAAAPTPAPKISVSLSLGKVGKQKKTKAYPTTAKTKQNKKALNPFFADDELSETEDSSASPKATPNFLTLDTIKHGPPEEEPPRKRSKTRGRWDKAPTPAAPTQTADDALDNFMKKLEAGALGNVTSQRGAAESDALLKINVSGSMIPRKKAAPHPVSGGVITPEELERLSSKKSKGEKSSLERDALAMDEDGPRYTQSDWESEASKSEVSENATSFRRVPNYVYIVDLNLLE